MESENGIDVGEKAASESGFDIVALTTFVFIFRSFAFLLFF